MLVDADKAQVAELKHGQTGVGPCDCDTLPHSPFCATRIRPLLSPTVTLVRQAIFTLLDEGQNGKEWNFYDPDEGMANAARVDFADALVAFLPAAEAQVAELKSPEKMWDAFIDALQKEAGMMATPVNLLGSVEAHKKIFLGAAKEGK